MPDPRQVLSQDHQQERHQPCSWGVCTRAKEHHPITQRPITTELLVIIQPTSACEMDYQVELMPSSQVEHKDT